MLLGLGIYPKSLGFTYIVEAILLLDKKETVNVSIVKNIYMTIGESYKLKSNGVERCILNCIENVNKESMEEYFGIRIKDKLTNKEILTLLYTKIFF